MFLYARAKYIRPDNLDVSYDRDADVLYISIGGPKPAISESIADGVLLRRHIDANEIVGIAIESFPKLRKEDLAKALEVEREGLDFTSGLLESDVLAKLMVKSLVTVHPPHVIVILSAAKNRSRCAEWRFFTPLCSVQNDSGGGAELLESLPERMQRRFQLADSLLVESLEIAHHQ